MRRMSLAHLTVLDADPIGLIDAGKEGGFDAVGLRVVPPLRGDTIIPVVGDVALQKRIKQRLGDTDMEILDIEAIWIQPDTNVASLRGALEVGRDLGARYVLTVGMTKTASASPRISVHSANLPIRAGCAPCWSSFHMRPSARSQKRTSCLNP